MLDIKAILCFLYSTEVYVVEDAVKPVFNKHSIKLVVFVFNAQTFHFKYTIYLNSMHNR